MPKLIEQDQSQLALGWPEDSTGLALARLETIEGNIAEALICLRDWWNNDGSDYDVEVAASILKDTWATVCEAMDYLMPEGM